MSDGKLKLSLAMIVKDEEACIRKCLDSAADLVEEMVIVDTGSIDKTIDICRSYGAQVLSYPWNNDFAAARNFGLTRVTQDWVLWLDADEEISRENRDQLNDMLFLDDYDALSVPLVNFYGEKVDENEVIQIAQPRFFRHNMGFLFESKIHEWLNLSAAYEHNRVGFLDLKIYHYGYLNSSVENKRKYERNVNLLLKELKEDSSQPWVHYYIATEHHRQKDYIKAFEHVNQGIRLFLNQGLIPPPSMLYYLKYSILIETASWDGAWPGIKSAVRMFPDYVDLRFFMGVILYYKEMYKDALTCFEECIKMGENNPNYLSVKGFGSFRAWYYAGLCYESLQNNEKAILAHLNALEISSTFVAAREALFRLSSEKPDGFIDHIKNHRASEEESNMTDCLARSFYDKDYFDNGCRSGKSNYADYSWERIGGEVERTASHIINKFAPAKSLDVGCAKGFMVKALYDRGVDAYGIDASEYAVTKAPEAVNDRIRIGLAYDLPYADSQFDLVTIFDVLEHIPEELAERTCAELLRVSSRWVLAYVVTKHELDDIDPSHVNIKPREWWEAKFAALGGKLCSTDAIYDLNIWWFNLADRLMVIEK